MRGRLPAALWVRRWRSGQLMSRPLPTRVMHFTHVTHLHTIVQLGLLCDAHAHRDGALVAEVGDHGVKRRRRERPVPCPPGGVVADYVPFYYAPRSPVMFKLDRGGVPTYQDGCAELVYLATSVERLAATGQTLVFTDSNAALKVARFSNDVSEIDELVDWPLMSERMWNSTPDDPDRMDRRMAECLVHHAVPWAAVEMVVAKSEACASTALRALATVGATTPVVVRPGWYF